MPKRSGQKLRSNVEAKKTSTDQVCPNQHDLFQQKSGLAVKEKVRPVRRLSDKQKELESEQSQESSALMHLKNTNEGNKTNEKSSVVVKGCDKKTHMNVSPHDEVLKNKNDKFVNISSDKKELSDVVDQLKNECVNLLGAEKFIKILKQSLTISNQVLAKVETDDENESIKTATGVASDSEDQREDQNTSSEAESVANHNLPKCSDHQSMRLQNYIVKLNNAKSGQEKYIVILEEFSDCCCQISGSMLYIEDTFKNLKCSICCTCVDLAKWSNIFLEEIESMNSLISLFEEKAKHHRGLAEFVLQFLQSSKLTVTEVIEIENKKFSCNETEPYNDVKATVQNLYYIGGLCRIIYHILTKLLVVKKLTIDRNDKSWKKISGKLLSNFQEELIALEDVMTPELVELKRNLVEQAICCIETAIYKLRNEVEK